MCDCDHDCEFDWLQLVWKRKKARKTYACEACGHTIKPREPYRYSKGLYDGTFYVQRRCLRCDLIAEAMLARGCDPNFEMKDVWEECPLEEIEGPHVTDTEPVCALVFMTQPELEARA